MKADQEISEAATPRNMSDGEHHFDVEHGEHQEHHEAPLVKSGKLGSMVHNFAANHQAPAHGPGIANPGPLGLMCFGMTTLMLMYVEAEWVTPAFKDVVTCYALFFGGGTQLLAGMWEMAKGNTFAATAFSSYGCFWMGWAILRVLKAQNVNGAFAFGPSATDPEVMAEFQKAEGLFLGQWGVMSFLYFLCTLRKCRALQFIFFTVTIAFFLLAGSHTMEGEMSKNSGIAGGYVGLICASTAVYLSIGEIMHETYGIKWPGCTV